ncbi:hypothetical protein ACMYYO_00230 [Dermacoccaceae bacterium W4C1]
MTELIERPTSGAQDCATEAPVWFYRWNPFQRSRLTQAELRVQLQAVAAAEAGVEEARQNALETLHELIGAAEEEARKPLLAVSRAVRRGKRVPETADLPDAVAAYVAAQGRLSQQQESFADLYPATLRHERKLLATLLTDESLAASLALVSPEVGRQATRYSTAVATTGEGNSRLLKSERGLLQYMLRAATRTSPLSRLTAVALTSPQAGGDHPGDPQVLSEQSFFAVDRVMLDYVLSGATEDSTDPTIALPPTSAATAERLFYLEPQTGGGYRRVAVPLRPPLSGIVGVLGLGPVPLSQLAIAAADDTHSDSAVAAFVRQAVLRGALCTVDPTTDADLLDLGPRGSAVDPALATLRTCLEQLATSSSSDRADLLAEVDQTLAELSTTTGRPARISVTEDRIGRVAPIDPDLLGPALDDLGPAVELLHTFDWLADVALALRDAFVGQHGAGGSGRLVDIAGDLVAEVTERAAAMSAQYADDTSEAATAAAGNSTLEQLYRVRRAVEREVHQLFATALQNDEHEVVLDPARVRALLADMPAELRSRPLGYGVLTQTVGEQLVINDGLPGHGMLHSRFLGMDRAVGGDAIDRLRAGLYARYSEPGVRLVEDRSLHNLNVNVHPAVLEDTLEPQDWSRLRLHHDTDQDRLQVMDGAQPVKVLPLGGGHPGLYPPPLSVASGLVIAGRLYNGLPDTFALAQSHGDDEGALPTRRIPRMRVGNVVISRARWFPGEDLFEALAATDEHERALAVNRWRVQHGVPEEVFIKSVPADSGPASVGAPEAQEARFRAKPQYMDLTSALCVRVLPRMLERRGGSQAPTVYLEEAAPGIEEGACAAEWVIEVHRPADGHFSYGGRS